jgi:hypothetical protein
LNHLVEKPACSGQKQTRETVRSQTLEQLVHETSIEPPDDTRGQPTVLRDHRSMTDQVRRPLTLTGVGV